MSRFVITGGRSLRGTLRVCGAKNSALPIMAASLLAESPCQLQSIPWIKDVQHMIAIMEDLGAPLRWEGNRHEGTLYAWSGDSLLANIRDGLMRQMRSSVLLSGPLLARCGRVQMTYPGGCAIGARPIDLHLAGLQQMGARISEQAQAVTVTVPPGGLRGADIHLEYPSVGATENLMMAATRADGVTRIWNPASEPEIEDLAAFLNAMGARVTGTGSGVISIEGVSELQGAPFTIMPDRIEAGTYMIAGAMTRGDVTLENVNPHHLGSLIAKLVEMGSSVEITAEALRVSSGERLRAADIRTAPYPGFPTDLQNQFMALACIATGTSVITETVFDDRFKVVSEFRRMGASLQVEGRMAVVGGVAQLSGAWVEASQDLRGAAALVLAGLCADGETVVDGAEFVDRGYVDLPGRLSALGACITRAD